MHESIFFYLHPFNTTEAVRNNTARPSLIRVYITQIKRQMNKKYRNPCKNAYRVQVLTCATSKLKITSKRGVPAEVKKVINVTRS